MPGRTLRSISPGAGSSGPATPTSTTTTSAPTSAANAFTTAPPARKLATICAVTSCGHGVTPWACTPWSAAKTATVAGVGRGAGQLPAIPASCAATSSRTPSEPGGLVIRSSRSRAARSAAASRGVTAAIVVPRSVPANGSGLGHRPWCQAAGRRARALGPERGGGQQEGGGRDLAHRAHHVAGRAAEAGRRAAVQQLGREQRDGVRRRAAARRRRGRRRAGRRRPRGPRRPARARPATPATRCRRPRRPSDEPAAIGTPGRPVRAIARRATTTAAQTGSHPSSAASRTAAQADLEQQRQHQRDDAERADVAPVHHLQRPVAVAHADPARRRCRPARRGAGRG